MKERKSWKDKGRTKGGSAYEEEKNSEVRQRKINKKDTNMKREKTRRKK